MAKAEDIDGWGSDKEHKAIEEINKIIEQLKKLRAELAEDTLHEYDFIADYH